MFQQKIPKCVHFLRSRFLQGSRLGNQACGRVVYPRFTTLPSDNIPSVCSLAHVLSLQHAILEAHVGSVVGIHPTDPSGT